MDWNQFVISRMTPKFKKLSEKQKERRKKNIYPHRLSRKGYARLAEDIKDDLYGDEEIDRAIMWKKARLTKEGDVEDENLKTVIQRIDDLIHEKEKRISSQKVVRLIFLHLPSMKLNILGVCKVLGLT